MNDPESALDIVTVLARAPDGRLAIAQPGDASIWIFSPTGERIQVVGGRGDGPEEFQAVSAMEWRGDTLWAADGTLFRVTDPRAGTPTVVGGADRHSEAVIRAKPARQAHPMSEHPLFPMAPDASTLTTVRREVERGGYAVTRVRVTGDTVFHREHAVRPEPISGATRRAILEEHVSAETLQRAPPSTRALQGAVESGLNLPAAHPAVTKIVVGSDGRTWLRGPDDRSGTVPWTGLGPTGEPQWIWAVVDDELEVPYVVRYELRPATGGGN